ncbi:hypothetical protein LME02_08040 [Leuconostoc mesenteroides subsp. dextranicum]|nr:hypothetical protein LME02_08040 [Leuconostoc mesenteroides subsp. dextranicum]
MNKMTIKYNGIPRLKFCQSAADRLNPSNRLPIIKITIVFLIYKPGTHINFMSEQIAAVTPTIGAMLIKILPSF